MLSSSKQRLYGAIRSFRTCTLAYASHYDVLGLTPKATQHDIKSAYYRLSKLYHPDKSDSVEAANQFRSITEAYEVLGNVNLKKMYDKGLIVGHENTSRMGYRPDPEPTDPVLKFYKSRLKRTITPTMDGRTPVYNFDEWSKNHYGDLLKKNQYNKEFVKRKRASDLDMMQSNRQEVLLYMMFALGGLFVFCVINGTSDYDKVKSKNRQEDIHDTINK